MVCGVQVSDFSWYELAQLRWGDSEEGVVLVKPLLQTLQPALNTIILDIKPTLDVRLRHMHGPFLWHNLLGLAGIAGINGCLPAKE